MAGFWKAPRALARLLAQHELTFNAYGLLHFVAELGADRDEGIVTSNGFLADSLELSRKTVIRTLRTLRARGFIEFEDHPGVATFTLRTSPALDALPGTRPGTPPGTPETQVVSQATSDTAWDTPAPASARKPTSIKGKAADSTWDTPSDSRARARETETETEKTAAAEELASGNSEELARTLAPLERADGYPLNGPGRDLVAAAYAESPDGVSALVGALTTRRQTGALRSACGTLVEAVRRGEHRQVAATKSQSRARRAACPHCGVGAGAHTVDCPTVIDREADDD